MRRAVNNTVPVITKMENMLMMLTFNAILACGTTFQGWGRSRNTASAASIRSNPSSHTSLTTEYILYSRVADSDLIGSVDPDPDSGSGFGIRIRNPDPNPGGQKWTTKVENNPDPDQDPGGQKWPTKVEIFLTVHVLKCWMASFESCRLLL